MRLVERLESWEEMRAAFRWPRPRRYNIAEEICERWARAEPGRPALILPRPGGEEIVTYGRLSRESARLANVLAASGLGRGDRCAILLPQSAEVTLAHLACHRLGAVAVPLFTLFGEDGLRHRLSDSGAAALITDAADLPKIAAIRDDLPDLRLVLSVDGPGDGAAGLREEMAKARDSGPVAETGPDDPALLAYTSGTTGPPKGALHGHGVLLGHLPGTETHHGFFPQPGDRMWTPADWAWMGGLANVMMPSLAHGAPVVAHRMGRFDPEEALHLIARCGVRNVFMPPTALRLMRREISGRRETGLRSLASAGEAMGAEVLAWGREALGLTINEFYGQTECNQVIGNCFEIFAPRPGSTGRATPGHDVAVIDADGAPLPPGKSGEIAVRSPDPAMFLRYWGLPEKTREKFRGEWMLTGDVGWADGDGYFHFSARADDVITSSGYRIGPAEIEDCATGHPAVALAAAVGVPDPVRTEVVRLFVVLRPGAAAEGVGDAVTALVRDRLGPHVAPRSVEVVESLPMTATGKIRRKELREAQ